MAKKEQELLEKIVELLTPLSAIAQQQINNDHQARQIANVKNQLFAKWVEQENAKKDGEDKKDKD